MPVRKAALLYTQVYSALFTSSIDIARALYRSHTIHNTPERLSLLRALYSITLLTIALNLGFLGALARMLSTPDTPSSFVELVGGVRLSTQ